MATTSAVHARSAGSVTASDISSNLHRRAVPLLLYGLTGFSGVLAEQGFEKYVALLVGATASASAVVLFTYFLGFALGSVAAGQLLKKARISRPMLTYGFIELLVGIACIAFSYSFHGLMERMAPLENLFHSGAMKLQFRFACGCALVLPAAALMGASFPFDCGRARSPRFHRQKALVAGLLRQPRGCVPGRSRRSLRDPAPHRPARRFMVVLCHRRGVFVFSIVMREPPRAQLDRDAHEWKPPGKQIRLLLAASFASGAVVFALEVIWTHLIAVVIGCSVYAFSWMLAAVLLGLLIGAFLVNRGVRQGQAMELPLLFQCAALTLLVQFALWDRVPVFFTITPPVPCRIPSTLRNPSRSMSPASCWFPHLLFWV